MSKLFLKLRDCTACSTAYQPTGPAAKYCAPCGKKIKTESARRRSYIHAVETGRIKNPGVGSGGNQEGSKNPFWKGGIGYGTNIRLKNLKNRCERCPSTKNLCIHHKDRDRTNNKPFNLETLCRSCHASEHQLHKNFNQH